MLVLNPTSVRFDTTTWDDVASVSVDRATTRVVEEWSDLGPHATLVDAAELRTTVKLARRIATGDLSMVQVGKFATLTFDTTPLWTDQGRKQVAIACVVTAVKTDLVQPAGAGAAKPTEPSVLQTITFIAQSTDGATDPVTVQDA